MYIGYTHKAAKQMGYPNTRVARKTGKPNKFPNEHNISQMAVKYFKWLKNIPTFSFPRPFKIYPN
jgi:hypothetical protein